MHSPSHVLALVPAKLTSTRIPEKNIADLGALPLFVHSVRAAKRLACIERVIVSTESPRVMALARSEDCEVRERPPELSDPRATNIDVLRDVFGETRNEGREVDLIVLLQPSHPVRDLADIDRAITRMVDTPSASTMLSVARVKKGVGTVDKEQWNALSVSGPRYVNRGNFYIFRPRLSLDQHDGYGDHVVAYEMKNPELDFDIDTPLDLGIVRAALEHMPEVQELVADATRVL